MSANGQLTAGELVKVQDNPIDGGAGIRLAQVAARAWLAMVAAAKLDGVLLWVAEPAGGYRSLATQWGMKTHPEEYGLNPASVVNIAAPGYSTHGDGMAVDIGSFPPTSDPNRYGHPGQQRRAWVLANAPRFGFARQFGENDPNHFRHDGTPTGTAPAGDDIQELDMPLTDAEKTDIAERAANLVVAKLLSGNILASRFASLFDRAIRIEGTVGEINAQLAAEGIAGVEKPIGVIVTQMHRNVVSLLPADQPVEPS